MSRGPGVWQRGILAALKVFPWFYIRDLLPDRARKSEQNALEHAAWRLVAEGRMEIKAYAHGRPRLLAVRNGLTVPGRPPRVCSRPLSVGQVLAVNLSHTYENAPHAPRRDVWSGWIHRRHSKDVS